MTDTGPLPAFPAPSGAASLYLGEVMHARLKPKGHRFSYSVFNLLIDLDRLGEAAGLSRFFSIGRFNLLSFRPEDHGDGAGVPADRIRRLARQAGVDLEGGRILLWCYPRVLGFAFNPISIYFGYGVDGRLALVVYEVRNTFGEMHSYVAPVLPGELTEAGLRQSRAKLFYVSPFIEMEQRYHFRIRPPGETLAVRILETDPEGPLLSATFSGKRNDLTSRAVLRACAGMPLMTLKVVAGIHWEALKLWLKGIRLVPRPPAPPPLSLEDGRPLPRETSTARDAGARPEQGADAAPRAAAEAGESLA